MKFYLARSRETGEYEPFFHLRRECALSSGVEVQEFDDSERRDRLGSEIVGICFRCSRDYLKKALKERVASAVPEETPLGAKIYSGMREKTKIICKDGQAVRTFEPYVVTVNGRRLDPRFDLVNHSPDGFAWGYGGSGPAQLAFAILCDLYGEEMARDFHQDFKEKVVRRLPENWRLTEADIFAAILEIQNERALRPSEPEEDFKPPVVIQPPTVAQAPKRRRRTATKRKTKTSPKPQSMIRVVSHG